MLAGYLRGSDPDDRLPETWRDLFVKPQSEWLLTEAYVHYAQSVAWADLLPAPPAQTENGIARNRRLTGQYDRHSPDYAWEIMRAFARAAHILLGHQDAYANEGYLRTATQWDNLRKLAAMVNYQPTPPASATTTATRSMVAKRRVTRKAMAPGAIRKAMARMMPTEDSIATMVADSSVSSP